MQSILLDGIFTTNGFFAMIFFALAYALFRDARKNSVRFSLVDKKSYILSLVSFLSGLVLLVMYIIQLIKVL